MANYCYYVVRRADGTLMMDSTGARKPELFVVKPRVARDSRCRVETVWIEFRKKRYMGP